MVEGARAALRVARLVSSLQRLDALGDHAAIQFDLGLARPAAGADAAALTLQVRPPAHEAGREVLQARELVAVKLSQVDKGVKEEDEGDGSE